MSYVRKKYVFPLLIAVLIAAPVLAEEESAPNASFGFSFTSGYYDHWQKAGEGTWYEGKCYGGGIVIESMFTSHFGVHGGVSFIYAEIKGKSFYAGQRIDFRFTSFSMSVPLCLMTSINANNFSFIILTGFTFSQIMMTRMETSNPAAPNNSDDLLPYLNPSMVAVTGGFLFKFRSSNYTDFFVGLISDFYFTDLMEKMDGQVIHPYDIRAVVGILFRTNIFPMNE